MENLENDPAYWRAKAEEARATADYLTNDRARQHMLNCAASYERIAHLAERGALTMPGGALRRELAPIRERSDKGLKAVAVRGVGPPPILHSKRPRLLRAAAVDKPSARIHAAIGSRSV